MLLYIMQSGCGSMQEMVVYEQNEKVSEKVSYYRNLISRAGPYTYLDSLKNSLVRILHLWISNLEPALEQVSSTDYVTMVIYSNTK